MARAADFTLSRTDAGRTVVCTGDWTAIEMGMANERLEEALAGVPEATVDLRQIGRCDTAGAYGILKAAQGAQAPPKLIARPELDRLIELVERAVKAEPTPHYQRRPFNELFERIGRGVIHLGLEAFDTMVFFGHLLVAIGRAIANPAQGALGGLLRAGRAGGPGRHPDRDGHHLLHRRGGRPPGREHAHARSARRSSWSS